MTVRNLSLTAMLPATARLVDGRAGTELDES